MSLVHFGERLKQCQSFLDALHQKDIAVSLSISMRGSVSFSAFTNSRNPIISLQCEGEVKNPNCVIRLRLSLSLISSRLTASDIMETNLTYVYPHTRVQSLVSILRTTVYHAFPVVTENRQNERDFMKGNILISNNIHFKVCPALLQISSSSFPSKWR